MNLMNISVDPSAVEVIDVDEIVDELQQRVEERRRITIRTDGLPIPSNYEPHAVHKPSWGGLLERAATDRSDPALARYHCGRQPHEVTKSDKMFDIV